jgi:hypothetical protein
MHSTSGGAVAADVVPKSRMTEGIGYFGLYATARRPSGLSSHSPSSENGEIRDFQFLFFSPPVYA